MPEKNKKKKGNRIMNKEKDMVKKDWYPLEETSGYGLERAELIRKARQGGAEVDDDARIAVCIDNGAAEVVAIEDFCDWVFMTAVGELYCPDTEQDIAAVEGCFKK